MTAILTATGRVRPGDLRPQERDGLAEFLEQLRRGEVDMTDEEVAAEIAENEMFS